MPTVKHQRALAEVHDLIRTPTAPSTWAAVRRATDAAFRARLLPGTAVLPAYPAAPQARAVTAVLASREIVVRSIGVARPIPPDVPWAVPRDGEWRVVVTEPTDFRLVHSHGLPAPLVDAALSPDRPTRFSGRAGTIVRTAIRAATPVWVDAHDLAVSDLAVPPVPDWRLVETYQRDTVDAFALMMTWALEQRSAQEDHRFAATAAHIRARLHDPALNTDGIAEHLGMSRRSLQALFEAEGGVATYIRRLRVNAALGLITSEDAPDLQTAAERSGLGSRRTFERAVRQVYDVTPGQARSYLMAGFLLRERSAGQLAPG